MPHASNEDLRQDLASAEKLARLLDDQFEIAGVKFGLDSLVGLIPGIGDAITAGLGLYPVHLVRKHNLGKRFMTRMLWNLLLDFLVGLVPVAGDAGDLLFKAHRKNFRLLREAADRRLRDSVVA
jgi:hypothetical protein